MSKKSFKR